MKNRKVIIFIILIIAFFIFFFILKADKTVLEKDFFKEENKQVNILFFGDMMLDRNVFLETKKFKDFNYPFLLLDSLLRDENIDFKVANLEGPITNFKSVSLGNNRMKFTISPEFLNVLKKYFNIFSLANNHMLDFEEQGYLQTKEFLNQASISFFGDLKNRKENLSVVVEKNNIKIGFIGYHGLYLKNLLNVIEKIKELDLKTDFLVVFAHWGQEYKNIPSNEQIKEAKIFIDAGVDLIIGSHPHVIQPIETYKNKLIFYSLGNFVFDQYFSEETMQGLCVKLIIDKNNAVYELIPLIMDKKAQPELAGQDILDELSSISDQFIKEQIKHGTIDLIIN